jgi:hypothetical protein
MTKDARGAGRPAKTGRTIASRPPILKPDFMAAGLHFLEILELI